jgi:hypothetical protein
LSVRGVPVVFAATVTLSFLPLFAKCKREARSSKHAMASAETCGIFQKAKVRERIGTIDRSIKF